MFLEIESTGRKRKLLNVTLIDKVELDDVDEVADLWSGGVLLTTSRIAYQFYCNRPDEFVTVMAKRAPALQTGQPAYVEYSPLNGIPKGA